ncbi:MAG: ABC transporter ATP-binding protein [Luteococcus sp.]|uniref:ABC transporter ATP-binding protein n=1 Tax=Luteococcus sp. TaxID=1969402 RepID=UPI002646FF87|nr:ABC transporter ATP-binding protein [Luteococcus sp.]MDN5564359.1 ABC transporter ATP-binding protein [Luteococcus sp.]
MTHVLEMRGVTRSYGSGDAQVLALDGLDLTLLPGEFIAVMGPSGSGKSTLLGLAGGLDAPTGGQITLAGTPLSGKSRDDLARLRRRSVGFVFQDFNLVPSLTAIENVMLPLELDGSSTKEARAAAEVALRRVGLTELADRTMDQMSGGQRQRIAIARAICGDRRLILADEPTGALDSNTGDEVMALLRDLADEGVAVILVTHEARHAGWADRVVFLRDGRQTDQAQSGAGDTAATLPLGPKRAS